MNTKQYIKSIRKTVQKLDAEIIGIESNKHLKVRIRWKGETRFVMFPSTPSNNNAEKLIEKKIRIFFSGELIHN